MRKLLVPLLLSLLAACASAPPEGDDAGLPDASVDDAGVDAGLDAGDVDAGTKADGCADTFGAAFTNSFGRADGTVVAVVPPGWQCPLPNGDHVVIQVRIDGGVQRLVVNVQSTIGDPNIRMRTLSAPLPAPAYEEGWHTGVALDYPTMGVHSDGGWDALTLEEAAARIYDAVDVGAPLSVYATSSGFSYAGSAHLIHRNGSQHDGAIVTQPTGAQPTWLLFHFADQSF